VQEVAYGFRLILTSVTLNDLERRNDCRPALSLRQLSVSLQFSSVCAKSYSMLLCMFTFLWSSQAYFIVINK